MVCSHRLQGFCIKPPCPHTIVVEYMTICSSSELYLHRIVRGTEEKPCAEKRPIKLNVYRIFEKEYI